MTQVVPVNLAYNVKTLWFDPNGIELHAADDVVVSTARGLELGSVAGEPFDVPYEDVKALKSPLKPVLRQATPEDLERAKEMERLAEEAMPVFREMARETSEDMHPVSVEYLLDGDKKWAISIFFIIRFSQKFPGKRNNLQVIHVRHLC